MNDSFTTERRCYAYFFLFFIHWYLKWIKQVASSLDGTIAFLLDWFIYFSYLLSIEIIWMRVLAFFENFWEQTNIGIVD